MRLLFEVHFNEAKEIAAWYQNSVLVIAPSYSRVFFKSVSSEITDFK